MLFIAVLSCERAARPGRADRTVTRNLSQAGSYQVTTARTGRPDATDAAPGPGIDRSASTTPKGVSFVVGQIPSPNTARVCSLFRREGPLSLVVSQVSRSSPALLRPRRRTALVLQDPRAGRSHGPAARLMGGARPLLLGRLVLSLICGFAVLVGRVA